MTQTTSSLAEFMAARSSVRKYDPEFKISREELKEMIEEAKTAPSASNVQSWRFLIVDDQEQKKALREVAFGQEQIETASAVYVVIGDLAMDQNIEKIYNANVEQGYMPREVADANIASTKVMYDSFDQNMRLNITHFDTALITMQLLLLAKDRGYGAGPMAGFDKEKVAELFSLKENEYPVLLIVVGKEVGKAYNTSRLPFEEIANFTS